MRSPPRSSGASAISAARGCACSASPAQRASPRQLPADPHGFEFRPGRALIGLADPVRPAVPAAIASADAAGIRVVMITGDYPVTAVNIGRQIGLASPGSIGVSREPS